MRQRIWYYALRTYVWIGLHFYFRKIIVRGLENIPKDHAVLFTPNHQNAFMDALLVVATNHRYTHFLTRADVFKKGFIHWLLSTLNLIPVYRIRDGWSSLDKNQESFNQCSACFEKGECVLIFPEGNHGMLRRVRPLSKGFTRVVFEALQKNPDMKLSVVPVGLNYTHHTSFFGSVSIYYGKPIAAVDYFMQQQPQGANELRHTLSSSMKKLITHVADEVHYETIISELNQRGADYLNPIAVNKLISELTIHNNDSQTIRSKKLKTIKLFAPIYYLLYSINLAPLLWWKKIVSGVKDPVFISSLKFAFGIFVLPIYYAVALLLSLLFVDYTVTLLLLIICVVSLPVMATLRKYIN